MVFGAREIPWGGVKFPRAALPTMALKTKGLKALMGKSYKSMDVGI